jgi:hypothetical protein
LQQYFFFHPPNIWYISLYNSIIYYIIPISGNLFESHNNLNQQRLNRYSENYDFSRRKTRKNLKFTEGITLKNWFLRRLLSYFWQKGIGEKKNYFYQYNLIWDDTFPLFFFVPTEIVSERQFWLWHFTDFLFLGTKTFIWLHDI